MIKHINFYQQDTATFYTANHKYDEWEDNTILTAVHWKKICRLSKYGNMKLCQLLSSILSHRLSKGRVMLGAI